LERIVVDEASDGLSGGRWLLRAMSDQSERARAFNLQMKWFRLRGLPADREPEPDVVVLPDDVVVLPEAAESTIDLTATAAQAVPRQRD
jgi:hypothetical protein